MESGTLRQQTGQSSNTLLLGFALATFALHIVATAFCAYGYFRDELYYIACASHLDTGYVDQPSFSIYVLAVNRLLLGDSLVALRFLPAVAHAVTVLLTGLMARELGGSRTAQTLAAVASLVSPIYLGMTGIFSMNSFDILVWTAAAYLLILILKTPFDSPQPSAATSEGDTRNMQPPRLWLLLGLALGIGLLNKISVLWLGAGIAAGLLLTPHRRWLKTPWPWLAGGIAFLVFLPYIIWNLQHNLAHLEFIHNASAGKYSSLDPLGFTLGQALLQNPFSLPLWIAGLVFLLLNKDQSTFRPLGIIYIVAFTILVVNGHSKPEYLSAAYGMLFAGGGVAIENFIVRTGRRWLQPAYFLVLLLSGCVLAPFTLPLLPVETFIRYQSALGIAPSTAEGKKLEDLPQFYADMFGWKEKAAAVARVFNRLTPAEKARCTIFSGNYGRCGAIDFFGPEFGLPKSIGSHNNYWIWGPGNSDADIVIVLGGNPEDCRRTFEEVTVVDTASCIYCMPYENHLPISICRKPRKSIAEVWRDIKHYE